MNRLHLRELVVLREMLKQVLKYYFRGWTKNHWLTTDFSGGPLY